MSHIAHVVDYDEYISLITTKNCAVKFTAPWCGPCRTIVPTFVELAKVHSTSITCIEVNIDEADEISNHEDIKSIPYMVFYQNGKKDNNLTIRGANKELLVKNFTEFTNKIRVENVIEKLSLDDDDESSLDIPDDDTIHEDDVVGDDILIEKVVEM